MGQGIKNFNWKLPQFFSINLGPLLEGCKHQKKKKNPNFHIHLPILGEGNLFLWGKLLEVVGTSGMGHLTDMLQLCFEKI